MLEFSEGLGLNEFKSSPYWISATLKCNKKVGINLYGEENNMIDEEREIIKLAWWKGFHAKIKEVYRPP